MRLTHQICRASNRHHVWRVKQALKYLLICHMRERERNKAERRHRKEIEKSISLTIMRDILKSYISGKHQYTMKGMKHRYFYAQLPK